MKHVNFEPNLRLNPDFLERDTPRPCCMHLRNKSMWYREDERPGLLHDSNAIHYWCTFTQAPVGRDKLSADPKCCQPGRPCYEREEL